MSSDKVLQKPRAARFRRLAKFKLANFALPAFIVLLALIARAAAPRFFSVSNIENLARQMVPLLIVSVGQAFAIISGGLDLSIAAVLSLAGVAGVLVMQQAGLAVGLAVMLLTGAIIGFVSGAVIAYLRTSPLIVTLGMLSISQGLALMLANGVPIYDVPPAMVQQIGFAELYGIPVTVILGILTLASGWFLLRKTIFGRYVYAIGSSFSAATKSGIDVRFYTMLVYGFSGFTSGIAAVVLTAWVGAAQPVAAPDLTLQSLAAVVLGGVALTGGSGGMIQVIYGVVILAMLSNAMDMMGISAHFQMVAVGVVIILAVVLDRFRRGNLA